MFALAARIAQHLPVGTDFPLDQIVAHLENITSMRTRFLPLANAEEWHNQATLIHNTQGVGVQATTTILGQPNRAPFRAEPVANNPGVVST